MRVLARRTAGLLVLAGALAGAGAAHAQTVPLSACAHKERGDRSLCGHVVVPLDRSGHVPGTVSLKVRTVPPKRGPGSGAVVVLAGGPGQSATPLIDELPDLFGSLLDTRSLITFDQRGTGDTALRCPSIEGTDPTATDDATIVARCATRLGAARTAYTTAASVEDIDAVRAALGVDKLILVGVSYGTKVALNYAQSHPDHVERLVLDSVVAPEGHDPFARSTFNAIPRVLRAICHRGCAFTPDPAADLARVVHHMRRAPLKGHVIDRRGRARRATLDAVDVLAMLLSGDGDPFERAGFPSAMRSARLGDPAPLLRLAHAAGSDGELDVHDVSPTLYLATTCEDGLVPWPAGTPIADRERAINAALAALPAGTFAPFAADDARKLGAIEACRRWPESPLPQEFGPLPTLPTLIISGDLDLRTPRSDALALSARIPGAQVLAVPGAGHSALLSDSSRCATNALKAFVDGRLVRRCTRAAEALLGNAPLAPARLSGVPGKRGLPRDVGRTLHAVELTLTDLDSRTLEGYVSFLRTLDTRSLTFGGLRSGYAHMGTIYHAHRYSYVPGVAISFHADADARRLTVTVSGSAAAHGRLRLAKGHLTGSLGGTRIAVRFHTTLIGTGPGAARAASRRVTRWLLPRT
jgi:pimeloyl-ACP methyl ester carboxylesterase